MSEVDTLLNRIDAEFEAAKQRVAAFQQQKVAEYEQRQQRLEAFAKVCDHLGQTWKPRLDALAQRLGERASVKPVVTPTLREADFHVQSPFARVELKLSATTDDEVRNLILNYHLDILPILMKFKNADRLEMPLDKVDSQVVAAWIDDRIVDFVKTYLELHQNEQYLNYLKNYMVEDPIAHIRFPKYAAAAKCDWKGTTHYFIGEKTCREFREQNGIQ